MSSSRSGRRSNPCSSSHSSRSEPVSKTAGSPDLAPAAAARVLPMELRIGDRITDETGEWEVIGRPYTTAGGKSACVRVQRVGRPAVTELRTCGAHERIGVKRSASPPGAPGST
jgi:hypothetical protein